MKFLKSIISALLVAVIFWESELLASATTIAADIRFENVNAQMVETIALYNDDPGLVDSGWYICDVMVGYGETLADAEKNVKQKGYYPYPYDTNAGGAGLATCIGYKLTQDKNEAITGLAVMDQYGGYEEFDYQQTLRDGVSGLKDMVNGMMNACATMRNNLEKGSEAAKIALEFLNKYHVPGDDADTVSKRIPLGKYLLDKNRTYDDYEKIILVGNTDVVTYINTQLGAACSDCYVVEEKDRTVYVGSMTDDKDWLPRAFDAVLNHNFLFCINDDSLDDYWLHLMDDTYTEVNLLEKSLQYNKFTEEAERYLKSIKNTAGENGEPKEIVNVVYTDLYDFLCNAPDRLMYAFVSALPAGLSTAYFVDIVNLSCADVNNGGVFPLYYAKSPEVESLWMKTAMNTIREKGYDAENQAWLEERYAHCASYRKDVELFVSFIDSFAADYNNAIDAFGEVCGVYPTTIADTDEDAVLAELRSKGIDVTEDDLESLTDDLAVLGAYTTLTNYNIITDRSDLGTYQFPPSYRSWESAEPQENEPKNLGEYLIYISEYMGKTTSETLKVKVVLSLALYDALSAAQRYNMSSCGLTAFFNWGSLGGAGIKAYRDALEEDGKDFDDAIKKCTGGSTLSVWYGRHEDLYDMKNLYRTNKAIQEKALENAQLRSIDEKKQSEEYSAYLSRCSQWCSLASIGAGILMTISLIFVTVEQFGGFLGMFKAIGALAGAICMKANIAAAAISSCIGAAVGGILFIISILLIIAFIVLLVVSKQEPVKPDVEFSPIPETMIDCPDEANIAYIVRYDVARDQNGDPADFNKNSKRQWIALYYSKDAAAGSPLMCKSSTDPGFTIKYGDGSTPEDMYPLAKFEETVAFNLNSDQKVDSKDVTGIFMFYTTIDSANKIVKDNSGKYIAALKLGVALDEMTAKNAASIEEGYNLLNVNLTPNSKEYCKKNYYTYIGYKTTNSAEYAITDIRASYATDASEVFFGDCRYFNALSATKISCPINTTTSSKDDSDPTPFYYQLYYSFSSNAGDPILADSLRVISNVSELQKNEEYVRCFSGEAFDPQAEIGKFIANKNRVGLKDDKIFYPKHHFLAYSDEKPADFDGSKTYLAGFSFYYGCRFMAIAYHNEFGNYLTHWDELLFDRESAKYGVTLFHVNLTPYHGFLTPYEERFKKDSTFIGYSTTNNPKKAIYSINLFVGEDAARISGRFPSNINSNGMAYEASNIYVIKDANETIRYSHAYVSGAYLAGTTKEMYYPDLWMGYNTNQKERVLYQAGPTSDPKYGPILLENVIITSSPTALPLINGDNSAFTYLATGKKVEGGLEDNYRSVHHLAETFHDVYDADGQLLTPGSNLGFPHKDYDSSLFIYYRNSDKKFERGTFVSKVELVGIAGGYGAVDTALIQAISAGDDIIGLDYPLGVDEENAYPVDDNPVFNGRNGTMRWVDYAFWTSWGWYAYDYAAEYLSVTYSNYETDAVGTVVVSTNKKGDELPAFKELAMDSSGTKTSCQKANFSAESQSYVYVGYDKVQLMHTLYTSRNGTPIGRIMIGRNKTVDLELDGRGYRYVKNEDGSIFCALAGEDIYRQNIVLVDAKRGTYIEDIIAFDSMDTYGTWNELMRNGYQEMISADALSGLGAGRVHFALKRTTSSVKAIKDIMCSPRDLGETYTYEGRTYNRISNFNISRTVPLASQAVYIYTTKGSNADNSGANPLYLGLRNIGILVESDRSSVVYWNGDSEFTGLSSAVRDGTATRRNGDKTETVKLLMTTNIEGSLGLLDGGAFDKQNEYLKQYTESQYETFRKTVGNCRLVFTNNSDTKAADYKSGYTGATTIDAGGITVIILSVLALAAMASAFAVAKKKRKEQQSQAK